MITKGIVTFKLRCLQREFIKRKLEYVDVLSLLLYPYYLQKIKDLYPDILIDQSEEGYDNLLSRLEKNNDETFIQNETYHLVLEFIELCKIMSISPYSSVERFITAMNLIQTDHISYMDSNFIKVNFVSDSFPCYDIKED